jgi:hypothetical protein
MKFCLEPSEVAETKIIREGEPYRDFGSAITKGG